MTTRITHRRQHNAKPRTIFFKPNDMGGLSARISNLEVIFTEIGAIVVTWGTITGEPCAHEFPGDPDDEMGYCPEEKGRDWRNCPKVDNCPYVFTKPIEEDSYIMTLAGQTFAELEKHIRDMFRRNWDGTDHSIEWPRPAASIFANALWKYDLSELKTAPSP